METNGSINDIIQKLSEETSGCSQSTGKLNQIGCYSDRRNSETDCAINQDVEHRMRIGRRQVGDRNWRFDGR